jgi:hypothetical protein
MAFNENTFFQYKESRALSGYRSAWLIKLPENGGKYSLLTASETVPYPFGDKENFEYDLLQSAVIGQVEGKTSLESKDIEVLHHRDNAYRFEKLKGKTWDMMCINGEYMGYKFTGTIDYRPNDAEADVNRATVTITPMDAETIPVYNARPEILETLCLASAIPASIKVTESIDLSVKQSDAVVSVSAVKIADGSNTESDATTDVVSTDMKKVTFSSAGLYALTVKADGYASWTTTVYVEA